MPSEDVLKIMSPHLSGQFERGLPILFTGAGFDSGAVNIAGRSLPSSRDLRDALWELCFPGESVEDTSSLPDLYAQAARRHPRQLAELLTRLLSVDADSLPEYYRTIFSFPWFRCYTLNIDNLEVSVGRKFSLPRSIVSISATAPIMQRTVGVDMSRNLEVVHLNGTLADIPDNVTFSPMQYAERLARPEPWYVACVANLVSHPVVFIGTRLDEAPLWQHLELRKMRGGRQMQELRPRSYLVTPTLDRARQALLSEFNVVWVAMTAEQFANEVLLKIQDAAAAALKFTGYARGPEGSRTGVPEVASLARNPMQPSEFLLGQEPIWADLQSGRAIPRDNDEEIWRVVQSALGNSIRGLLVLNGTAGAGKTTAVMRVCLRLVAEGTRVGWIDKDSDMSPHEIRQAMKMNDAPTVLAIDDADLFGDELANLVREVTHGRSKPLVIAGIRSGRIDRVLNPPVLSGTPYHEIAVPHLTDADIGALIDVLDRENRLGILKGKPRHEQQAVFREQAGRQLLVAMIQATSGVPLKEKAIEELNDLQVEGRRMYALIAVASAFRFRLPKDELLVASGDHTNAALNALEQLIRRHIVTSLSEDGSIRARHRVIVDLILDELVKTGELRDILEGLAFVAATKVHPGLRRSARPWRLLRTIINHDFLARTIFPEPARDLYAGIESLLAWDYHYWLQRGSLEVEFGALALAENFLSQARSLAPEDPFVQTEWAYLLFRKSLEHPHSAESLAHVKEATELLEDLIDRTGVADTYPYHVLGSQGLSWLRKGIETNQGKEAYLSRLVAHLEDGCSKFPRVAELEQLLRDLKREMLNMAVVVRKESVI